MDQAASESKKSLTFLLVGDGGVGKTTIINTLANKKYIDSFNEHHILEKNIDFDSYSIKFIDYWSDEGYDVLAKKFLSKFKLKIDAILFCFSIKHKVSIKKHL